MAETQARHADAPSADMPAMARILGLAGLIPFIGGAVSVWLAPPDWGTVAMQAQMLYGAIILSFLGGLHWGRYLAGGVADGWLIWSVVPSILAWGVLVLPVFHALAALMVLLAICLAVDMRAIRQGLWPAWMAGLRRLLSVVAILSLAASLSRVLIGGGAP
jgi:hypothetical protein